MNQSPHISFYVFLTHFSFPQLQWGQQLLRWSRYIIEVENCRMLHWMLFLPLTTGKGRAKHQNGDTGPWKLKVLKSGSQSMKLGPSGRKEKQTTEYKDRGLQANYDEIQHFDNVEKGKLTKTLHSEGIFFVFFFTN